MKIPTLVRSFFIAGSVALLSLGATLAQDAAPAAPAADTTTPSAPADTTTPAAKPEASADEKLKKLEAQAQKLQDKITAATDDAAKAKLQTKLDALQKKIDALKAKG
jgi:uncharacterized protein YlxW (UPF0749 family)